MKASVILCIDPYIKNCFSQISLAYAVDRWWYEKQGYTALPVTAELPLYFAILVKDALAARLQSSPTVNWQTVDKHALVKEWIHETYTQLDQQWKTHFKKIWDKSKGVTIDNVSMSTEEIEVLQEDAQKILPYIEGRRWLVEHLEKRLKMLGVRFIGTNLNERHMRSYLQSVLQLLYLQKEIEITSGVVLRQHKGKLLAQCERCGSTDYGINLHYCSICDHEDLVCDTCYVMGVSKGCSVVISRERIADFKFTVQEKQQPLKSTAMASTNKYWTGEL